MADRIECIDIVKIERECFTSWKYDREKDINEFWTFRATPGNFLTNENVCYSSPKLLLAA